MRIDVRRREVSACRRGDSGPDQRRDVPAGDQLILKSHCSCFHYLCHALPAEARGSLGDSVSTAPCSPAQPSAAPLCSGKTSGRYRGNRTTVCRQTKEQAPYRNGLLTVVTSVAH
ncbi:hypothetical protein AGOR_G00162820 [Albula goreensis]|uniref:Uncharacterized protein n=1 Tax=Albula goreensis TaxID=1534307 RepID=A0A8T3CW02_9TELE|nr:hypothetical protein AGOR_G00162820 [Albula goreensis]